MAILEQKQIYDDSKKAFTQLEKDLDTINKEVVTLTKSSNELAKALALVKKSNDGTEARKLAEGTKRLTLETKKLVDAEKVQQEIIKKQILETRKLEKAEQERIRTEKAQIQLSKAKATQIKKVLTEYQKESRLLTELRNKYKNLAVQNKQNTKEGKALLDSVTKLDAKLKAVDKSVGQNQRSVGKYSNALKGLGTQLLGAAGITAGLGTVIAAGKAFVKTAGELITITKQAEKTFGLTGNSAKVFAADVLSLAETFDKDYNQILEAANVVSKELDITATAALAHIQEGFAKGSNNTDEFLDILKEYPAQFRAAGIDAQTMFAIINQQVEQGIYSDKGVDAIKEGGLRLRENTKAVQEALIPLDESIKLQIEQEIAAGNSFKAIQLVSGALNDTSLTAEETQAIIADVFGGAGEDAGLRYLQTLQNIETSLDNVATQATESEQATLTLSRTWNRFVVGVADDESILTRLWANIKLVIAGLINEVTKFFNLFKSDEAIAETEKLTQEIEKNSEALDKNEQANLKEEKAVVKLTASQKKLNAELAKQNQAFKDRDTILAKQVSSIGATGVSGGGVTSPAELNQMLIDQKAAQDDKAREDELQNIQDWEDAKLAIQEQALNSGGQLAKDIFNNFQDERLAEINSQAEAEKAILQQRLDDGVISEEQFARQVSAIEKKQRIESAKAEKKKALFDVGINTALAVIKTFATLGFPLGIPASIAVAAIGAIQAAAIALKPIPKFAEGTEFVQGEGTGKSDSIHAMLSKGERVVPAEINSMLNNIPNSDLPGLLNNKQDSNMFLGGLLMQGNKHSKDLITLMSNMGWTYDRDGIRTINKADGSLIEKFNING